VRVDAVIETLVCCCRTELLVRWRGHLTVAVQRSSLFAASELLINVASLVSVCRTSASCLPSKDHARNGSRRSEIRQLLRWAARQRLPPNAHGGERVQLRILNRIDPYTCAHPELFQTPVMEERIEPNIVRT
jgi:hypothetical protein